MNDCNDQPDQDSSWQKTHFANLIRYKPSQVYFARFRVKGKLIRRSLKTDQITVAKLCLADLEKIERQKAQSAHAVVNGKMTFGGALAVFTTPVQATFGVSCKKPLKITFCDPASQCIIESLSLITLTRPGVGLTYVFTNVTPIRGLAPGGGSASRPCQ